MVEAIEDAVARRRADRHRPPFGHIATPKENPEEPCGDILPDLAKSGADEYIDPEDMLLEDVPAQERKMSRTEARDVLISLREETIKPTMPEVPPEQGLLRKGLLEALLAHLPQDETEFRDMIPLKLREATDAEQFSTFSKVVFRILRQVN